MHTKSAGMMIEVQKLQAKLHGSPSGLLSRERT